MHSDRPFTEKFTSNAATFRATDERGRCFLKIAQDAGSPAALSKYFHFSVSRCLCASAALVFRDYWVRLFSKCSRLFQPANFIETQESRHSLKSPVSQDALRSSSYYSSYSFACLEVRGSNISFEAMLAKKNNKRLRFPSCHNRNAIVHTCDLLTGGSPRRIV